MDPNANLVEQLELANYILDPKLRQHAADVEVEAERLAELVQAMHTWLVNGGELPAFWK